jgi:hypothetical protein
MSRINVANFRHPDGTDDNINLDSSGRVGVGTASPASKLHVYENSASPARIYLENTEGRYEIKADANLALHYSTQFVFNNAAGTQEYARINSSGNVGIGTTSPSTKLQVNGSWVNNYGTLNITGPDNDLIGVGFRNTSTNVGGVFFRDGTAGDFLELNAVGSRAIRALNNGTERARIDSSGRLLVGTSSARSLGLSCQAQIEGVTNATSSLSIVNNQNSAEPPYLFFGKSRAGSIGGVASVSNGDYIGLIRFAAADGTDMSSAAADISCQIDGTPGSNDTPGTLKFWTTSDGSPSPTERLRIRANGNTEPGADNTYTIGTSASRWGAVWAANGTIQTSDERTKTQIANAHLGFEFIKSLRPVSYRWIEGGKRETGERNEDGTAIYESVPGERTHYGFIAQEVKEAVDAAGVDFGGWLLSDKDDPDSQQALRYDQFIAPLTKALQEAITKIETLEGMVAVNNITIDEQQHQLSTLAARLTALESA